MNNKLPKKHELPIYLFHQGRNYDAADFFGAHAVIKPKKSGYEFRVWAPNAKSISVVGDFNDWNRNINPMKKVSDEIWLVFIADLKTFDVITSYSIQYTKLYDQIYPKLRHNSKRPLKLHQPLGQFVRCKFHLYHR